MARSLRLGLLGLALLAGLSTFAGLWLQEDPLSGSCAIEAANLRCEYLLSPFSDARKPRLSWEVSLAPGLSPAEFRDQVQSAFRILVSRRSLQDLALGRSTQLVWDTGQVMSSASAHLVYDGASLDSGDQLTWSVQVWDARGRACVTTQAHFEVTPRPVRADEIPYIRGSPETGLLSSSGTAWYDWHAQWITSPSPNTTHDCPGLEPAPLFRRTVTLSRPTEKLLLARLHVTGLGLYRIFIGGNDIGRPLDPAWTLYSARLFYQTFDVLDWVRGAAIDGAFVLGAEVGAGWYDSQRLKMWGQYVWRDKLPAGRPQLLIQLALLYSDGSWQRIVTEPEGAWSVVPDGPTRKNSVYLGEEFDARKRINGWAEAIETAERIPPWTAVVPGSAIRGFLRLQPIPSVQVVKEIVATRLSATVWDMRQNLAGVARLRVRGPRGAVVRLRFGEVLAADGSVNALTAVAGQIKQPGKGGPCSPAVAFQEDRYVLAGSGEFEEWQRRFGWHGFRFVEVRASAGVELVSLTGLLLSTDVQSVSEFVTSSDHLNALAMMVLSAHSSAHFSFSVECGAFASAGRPHLPVELNGRPVRLPTS